LVEPLRKIVHPVENSGIDGFKVRLVSIAGCIGVPEVLGLLIIQSFIENSVRRRKDLHCG
jgi:hypothetical protein